ncbi:hypothetical protein EJ06DRAFT_532985 [Trichodelitschia bisporula]|uniref:Uncharacterized protein n=1 Tax=Trichodelitschia bisporula TaxID=703511 RepID=A0A6G1HNF5_9PEZI|nr:hypothetical protein EJ06DRAFT_532985 [Trichodelitschia bisporula]
MVYESSNCGGVVAHKVTDHEPADRILPGTWRSTKCFKAEKPRLIRRADSSLPPPGFEDFGLNATRPSKSFMYVRTGLTDTCFTITGMIPEGSHYQVTPGYYCMVYGVDNCGGVVAYKVTDHEPSNRTLPGTWQSSKCYKAGNATLARREVGEEVSLFGIR